MNRLLRLFFPEMATDDAAATLDHVKVKRKRRKKDWRDEAVKRAADKHGKPFECGPAGVAREVLIGSEQTRTVVVKDAGATVTPIKRAKRNG